MTMTHFGDITPQLGQVAPTQTVHPWRATVRTIFAALVAALPLVPAVVSVAGVGSIPWIAGGVAAIGAVTRVLAIPGVEAWLKQWAPWLSAQPPLSHGDGTARL